MDTLQQKTELLFCIVVNPSLLKPMAFSMTLLLCILVPLEVYFVGNTPRVGVDSVEIQLATRGRSLPQTITCDLINGRGDLIQTKNCELKYIT